MNTQPSNIFGTGKPTTGIFGNTAATPATGGNIFGNLSNTATTSSTSPASNAGNIFGNTGSTPAAGSLFGGGSSATPSTTPAGTAPSVFGAPKPTGSLFGGGSNTGAASTTPAATSIFGNTATTSTTPSSGSIFGSQTPSAPKPGDSSSNNVPKPNIFGSAATSTTPGTTGISTASTPSTGLFGLPPKPAESTTAVPSGSTTQSGASSSTSTGSVGTAAKAATGGTGLFGGGNLFGKPAGASTTSMTPAATSTTGAATTPTGGLFSSKPEEKKEGAAATAAGSASAGFNPFGAKKDTPVNAAFPATAKDDKSSSSTTGTTAPSVAVPPPSMLRGKTLEEIVNRWSSDLETHVREFNRYAAEVAVWDRALIENGNNLTALYSHITAAERQQDNIDQSLNHIEQQQKDLATTLDAYEKMSQELLGGQNGSLRTLDTGPADTERDKNYMLATDLHTQLDDLSGSLTQMIDAVNGLSVSNKPNGESSDDPMTQISQILSSHLESLQWIDGAVREVDGKVTDIEKRVKDSGYSLTGNTNQGKSRGFGLNR